MRRKVVTSLIGMGNISIGQRLIPLSKASEATPMPRPLSVPLRQEIVRRRQQGMPLTQIAAEPAIPYGTVRNIWRLFRRDQREDLAPDYRSCGRPVPTRIQELLQIACDLKRDHPARGAGLIRLQLRKHVHEGGLPSIRSLQLAFARAGVNRPRHRRGAAVVVPSERGIGQAVPGERTDARADHRPRGQPPQIKLC